MSKSGTSSLPTRFRIRVLAKKFGKKYTTLSRSPVVSVASPPPPPGFVESLPDGDCDSDGTKNRVDADDDNDGLSDAIEQSLNLNPCNGDTDSDGIEDRFEFDCDHNGVLNRDESDDDKDLLADDLESRLGTDPCNTDTDGDSVEDGYEYKSAVDLNNDEYQNPNARFRTPASAVPEPAAHGRRRGLRRRQPDAGRGAGPAALHRRSARHARRWTTGLLGRLKYSVVPQRQRRPPRPGARRRRLRASDELRAVARHVRLRQGLPARRTAPATRTPMTLRDVDRDGDVTETTAAAATSTPSATTSTPATTAGCPTTSATRTPTASRTTRRRTAG